MIKLTYCLLFFAFTFGACAQNTGLTPRPKQKIKLFNGKNLEGWEGDTTIWRVEDGAIVGGNKMDQIKQNEFLSTTVSYKNFELEAKFKIKGYSGFINAGIQFHSQRLTSPPNEMAGYQADIGPDCMGSLYDESRRDKYLAKADQSKITLRNGWNLYKISCRNNIITLSINNKETITYSETDSTIPLSGKIGLQIHGGGVLEVFYKDIHIQPIY